MSSDSREQGPLTASLRRFWSRTADFPPALDRGAGSSLRPATEEPPRAATGRDIPVVTEILVSAFADDPVWGSWAFPDPATRSESREVLFSAIVTGAMRFTSVWVDAAETATAVWVPPGRDELTPALERRLRIALRRSMGARASVVLEACAAYAAARPTTPHYYLTLLGSRPGVAGRGRGTRLLRRSLEAVDAQGAPAYLEATDDLVGFYERFEFRVENRFLLPGGPPVNGMWRSGVTP